MLDGYNWVVNNATEEGKIGSSLVSMSLGEFLFPPSLSFLPSAFFLLNIPPKKLTHPPSPGWPTSQIINDAVEAAFQAGLLTVVSAGNDYGDPASKSPASAPNALTVGATDYARARAVYSNSGPLVDIWGPGNDVLSLAPEQGATAVKSGTSMSTPAVAGLVAYLRSLAGAALDTPAAATARVKGLALQGVVSDVGQSPNLFAHNGVGGNETSVSRR